MALPSAVDMTTMVVMVIGVVVIATSSSVTLVFRDIFTSCVAADVFIQRR